MAFGNNNYATIWEVRKTRGKSMNVRISTSRKDRDTGAYETDFSDYVFFVGKAAQKVANCKEKDRIRLLETSVTSQWDKEAKKCDYTFTVWDFEQVDSKQTGNSKQSVVMPKDPAKKSDDGDDGLPF